MRYEFRVHGPVPDSAAQVLPEPDAAALGEDTVLYGTVVDEAHLFGLLARFRVLGRLVTQMRQVPSPLDGDRPPPTDQP